MTPDENDELNKLEDAVRNCLPIDEDHPNVEQNLSPSDKEKLADLLNREEPLSEPEKKQLDHLKDQIVLGNPLDSTHPGVENLSPDQKKDLDDIENKQANQIPLSPVEEDKLGDIQDAIAHGQPLDSSHSGVNNLTENQKEKLNALEEKEPE